MSAVEAHIDVAVPLAAVYDRGRASRSCRASWPASTRSFSSTRPTCSGARSYDGTAAEWTCEVVELRPEERIAWRSTSGVTHGGVVSFLRLDDAMTRVMVMAVVDAGAARVGPRVRAALERLQGSCGSNGPQGEHGDVVADGGQRADRAVAPARSTVAAARAARRRARRRGELLGRHRHARARPPRSARRCRARACRPGAAPRVGPGGSGRGHEAEQRARARRPPPSTPSARTTSGSGWPPQATVTRAGERLEVQVRAGDRAEAVGAVGLLDHRVAQPAQDRASASGGGRPRRGSCSGPARSRRRPRRPCRRRRR